MEEYNNSSEMDHESQDTPRGNFLYASPNLGGNYGRAAAATSAASSDHNQQISNFHLQSSGGECFPSTQPTVKTEAAGSTSQHANHHHHKFHHPQFPPPSLVLSRGQNDQLPVQQQQQHIENENEVEAIKAKIIAHPHYSNLLQAYMDCQRVYELCIACSSRYGSVYYIIYSGPLAVLYIFHI